MSLMKKSDVKNHLSPRKDRGLDMFRSASEPDETGYSGTESESSNSKAEITMAESLLQPNSKRQTANSAEVALEPDSVAFPAVPKCVQL